MRRMKTNDEELYVYVDETNKKRYAIEFEGEGFGYCVYVYDLKTNRCTHDYLQDTIEMAMYCAETDLGVDKSLWVKMKSEGNESEN